jgi:hypothetical protein
MKMMKEKSKLLEFCRSTWFECRETIVGEDGYKKEKKLITAFEKAVREDERKLANEDFLRDRARGILAAIRRK